MVTGRGQSAIWDISYNKASRQVETLWSSQVVDECREVGEADIGSTPGQTAGRESPEVGYPRRRA